MILHLACCHMIAATKFVFLLLLELILMCLRFQILLLEGTLQVVDLTKLFDLFVVELDQVPRA